MIAFPIIAAAAYLLGSLNFSVIISKRHFKGDIRSRASKNAGATNMLRAYGARAALLVLLLDFLKGALAVLLARIGVMFFNAPELLIALSGFAAVFGHCYPLFFGFRGGKGSACAAGALLVCSPTVFAAIIILFAVIYFPTGYVSLASIFCALAYPAAALLFCEFSPNPPARFAGFALLTGALIISRHRENISRLLRSTEPKTYLSRQS